MRTPVDSRSLRQILLHSWRNSYWIVVVLALFIGSVTIGSSIVVDRVVHGTLRNVYPSDLFDGIAAAVLSGGALIRSQRRKRDLLARMQVVEDVNHHVRNALMAITVSAALRDDPVLNAQVKEANERIDWVLSDVLGKSLNHQYSQETEPRWKAGRQLKNR